MKKILINAQDDGYGICSDAQIAAVKRRMEIICEKMGLSWRYDSGAQDHPPDMHHDTELVFELAMNCRSSTPPNYTASIAAADVQCPLPSK